MQCPKVFATIALAIALAAAPSPKAAPSGARFRPVDAYLTALNDLLEQPSYLRCNYRYLSFGHLPPDEREEALRVLSYHVNSLSRCIRLLPINYGDRPAVVRIDVEEFKWLRVVWERLTNVEPYFHVDRIEWWPGGVWAIDGKHYPAGRYKQRAQAPHLTDSPEGLAAATELVKWTRSQTPVVRGDWFLNQTTIQVDRGGAGYYDFLRIKSGKDFDKLIGAVPEAEDVFGEIGVVVKRSNRVAINNRQLRRRRALGVSDWYTIDVNKSIRDKNLVRNLDGEKVKQASERVGGLPNGLPAFELEDANGKLQESVPDQFAGNTAALSPDTRVHAGILSCLTCHEGALHPVKDYVREVLLPNNLIPQTPDFKKARKLLDLYTTDLQESFARDMQTFETATNAVSGYTQKRLAQTYGRVWTRYAVDEVTIERAADECGVTVPEIEYALRRQLKVNDPRDPLDLVMAAWLAQPPDSVRREHYEEIAADLMRILKKYPRGQ